MTKAEYWKSIAKNFYTSLKLLQHTKNWSTVNQMLQDYEAEEPEEWISVEEAPTKNGYYLCCVTIINQFDEVFYTQEVCFYERNKGWYRVETPFSKTKECIRHWQPLPEPPKK